MTRGDGSAELITGDLVTNIDLAHGMTGAQVFMRWMIEHVSICCVFPVIAHCFNLIHRINEYGLANFCIVYIDFPPCRPWGGVRNQNIPLVN